MKIVREFNGCKVEIELEFVEMYDAYCAVQMLQMVEELNDFLDGEDYDPLAIPDEIKRGIAQEIHSEEIELPKSESWLRIAEEVVAKHKNLLREYKYKREGK